MEFLKILTLPPLITVALTLIFFFFRLSDVSSKSCNLNQVAKWMSQLGFWLYGVYHQQMVWCGGLFSRLILACDHPLCSIHPHTCVLRFISIYAHNKYVNNYHDQNLYVDHIRISVGNVHFVFKYFTSLDLLCSKFTIPSYGLFSPPLLKMFQWWLRHKHRLVNYIIKLCVSPVLDIVSCSVSSQSNNTIFAAEGMSMSGFVKVTRLFVKCATVVDFYVPFSIFTYSKLHENI